MPYIAKNDQLDYDRLLTEIHSTKIDTAGKLNFLLTSLALKYMLDMSPNANARPIEMRYEQMNAVVGAFDNAKDEFKRRLLNPYEEQKAFEASQHNCDPYEVLGL